MNHRAIALVVCLFLGASVLLIQPPTAAAQAQSNAGNLVGAVSDPEGARVPGATVTVRNLATNLSRTGVTDAEGVYRLLVLPPGKYEVTVEAKGFAKVRNPEVEVLIGQTATYDVAMALRPGEETIVVTTETQLIETQRTAVADTITPRQIENLPINQRDYLNFALLTSTAARDNAPAVGPAPTSGLNFGGQRARSNQVSVDGADATDNSINGVRSTVSQEAVQEFQIITNSYMPEFGRALGGVVNIVTKGGTNDVHGNLFAFIRNRHFEARNPFSTVSDPAFTRFQGGVTLGGPIKKDRTFYFLSLETRQREEEGFSSIGADNFGLITSGPFAGMTAQQRDFFLTCPLGAILCNTYLAIAAGGGQNALFGSNAFVGSNFIIPCTGCPNAPLFGPPLPASFVSLLAVRGNYPVEENTTFYSGRLDHRWNNNNSFFVRVNVTPSDVRGIQVNSQNQTFGQNSWSRTSDYSFRDLALVAQNVTTLGSNWVNEARFQFARRSFSYTPSVAPARPGEPLGGEGVGIQIGGFAFIGREPFSRVDRIEKRWQWTDNVSYLRGRHTFKFGGDINFIQIGPRFSNKQVFELNFGGIFNFGALPATTFSSFFASAPGITAVQAYGLGLPQIFIQGIGDSFSQFNNTAIAFYAQDSWRVRPNFTFNYGLRWEGEATPQLPAFNALTAQAEEALGVVEGIPRDWNNFQPRIGFSWDPWSDGKTAIRAAYGIFFDHPLLALAFNSDTADGAQSVQLAVPPGRACATAVTTNPLCLNASSIFQGVLSAPTTLFDYRAGEQRFNPFLANSIFVNQNYCPQVDPDAICRGGFPLFSLAFTIPTAQDFVFAYAQQWNLTFERELAHDFAISIGYSGVKGSHLNRPRDINRADPSLLVNNLLNALAAGLTVTGNSPFAVAVPVTFGCVDLGTTSIRVDVPGVFGLGFPGSDTCTGTGLPVATAAAFNFFRPSGPNFAFTGGLINLLPAPLQPLLFDANIRTVAVANGYPAGPGFFVPFADVTQQESSGASIYHGLTMDFRKRFGNHYMFLASYTWSHAIDDSTDLQTLLAPQEGRRPDLERGNSTLDQRHRFVFSAILESPFSRTDENVWHKVFADFVIAPIFQASSGRPFTVLTGTDTNLDFRSTTDRPSVVPAGTPGAIPSPFIAGAAFIPATVCATSTPVLGCSGNLGRNTFTRPEIWNLDLRVARKFYIGERWKAEFIVDMFNLFNRFNVGDVNPLCNPQGGTASCIAGQPTAALDTRQFQFGVKVSW